MNDDRQLSEKIIKEVSKSLDTVIDQGIWEGSPFLVSLGKKLRDIRDTFLQEVGGAVKLSSKEVAYLAERVALHSSHRLIYIALYSADGNNMQSWERILNNLPKQTISRPIYGGEADVVAMIKTKENKINEAYVAIYVNESDLLPIAAVKAPMDKLGKPLLMLKDKVLNLDNIQFFKHLSGTYHYVQGNLVLKPLEPA